MNASRWPNLPPHQLEVSVNSPNWCGGLIRTHDLWSTSCSISHVLIKGAHMSRICAICGKGPVAGRTIARRGLAKKKGGVGKKITGVTKRRFLPNLQTIRIIQKGTVKRTRVCTSCIKAGKIQKVIIRRGGL